MPRERRNQRAYAGLLACLLLGTVFVLGIGGLAWIGEAAEVGPARMLLVSLMVLGLSLLTGVTVFVPYGFIALGWLRLGDYRRDELAALPDDNTVGDPEAGERKYQEWLSAVNSTEAFLGMVPRSAPYVPPEQRPPEGARPPRTRLSRLGMALLFGATLLGASSAAIIAGQHDLGHGTGGAAARNASVIQLFVAALAGSLFGLPIGLVLALLFGRIEIEEEEDDTGRSGPETA